MARLLDSGGQGARPGCVLLAVAAPVEIRAVLRGLCASPPSLPQTQPPTTPPVWGVVTLPAPATGLTVDILHCGVGKANAAGAVARTLDPARHRAVLSVGIAGALPRVAPGPRTHALEESEFSVPVTGLVVGTGSVFADEGILTPEGYKDIASIGFPLLEGAPDGVMASDDALVRALALACDDAGRPCQQGTIATVSTCSATDALAIEIARRTGALAESMEGAAIGLVAHRLRVPFAEVRAMSNRTGDRGSQGWNVAGALDGLSAALGRALGLR